jgi:hypothetical protein
LFDVRDHRLVHLDDDQQQQPGLDESDDGVRVRDLAGGNGLGDLDREVDDADAEQERKQCCRGEFDPVDESGRRLRDAVVGGLRRGPLVRAFRRRWLFHVVASSVSADVTETGKSPGWLRGDASPTRTSKNGSHDRF